MSGTIDENENDTDKTKKTVKTGEATTINYETQPSSSRNYESCPSSSDHRAGSGDLAFSVGGLHVQADTITLGAETISQPEVRAHGESVYKWLEQKEDTPRRKSSPRGMKLNVRNTPHIRL